MSNWYGEMGGGIPKTDEQSADATIAAHDPLLDEFRKLEKAVLRRTCQHPRMLRISEMGHQTRYLCSDCGCPEDEMDVSVKRSLSVEKR